MSTSQISGLESFHRFIRKRLASKTTELISPEEALELWREEQESLAAIREGLADIEAGRTKSIEDFDRDFRKRHGIKEVT